MKSSRLGVKVRVECLADLDGVVDDEGVFKPGGLVEVWDRSSVKAVVLPNSKHESEDDGAPDEGPALLAFNGVSHLALLHASVVDFVEALE